MIVDANKAVERALMLFREGKLVMARALYEEVLVSEPNHFDANNLCGVLYLKMGELLLAEKCLRKALVICPDSTQVYNNLGSVFLASGQKEPALECFQKALKIDPEYADALYNNGLLLAQKGELDAAIGQYRLALKSKPGWFDLRRNLGNSLLKVGEYQEAKTTLLALVSEGAGDAASYNDLGAIYRILGENDLAVEFLRKAIEIDDECIDAHNNLGAVYVERGSFKLASNCYLKLTQLTPQSILAHNDYGIVLGMLNRWEEAVEASSKALELDPTYANAYVNLGSVYRGMRKHKLAIENLQKALEVEPTNTDALRNLGVVYKELNQLPKAEQCFSSALEYNQEDEEAWFYLSGLKKYSGMDDDITRMEGMLADENRDVEGRSLLAFGLGKAYEDMGDYSRAFSNFSLAQALKRSNTAFSLNMERQYFDDIITTFDSGYFSRLKIQSDHLEKSPIFIFGMPRSGTSLVEQILASHSEVFGCGELTYMEGAIDHIAKEKGISYPIFCQELDDDTVNRYRKAYMREVGKEIGEKVFFTDKMPANFLHIGLIYTFFPNAKFIHCRRSPLDTCLSIFRKRFVGNHPYAHELCDLGHYYKLYLKLVGHWHRTMPGKIYDVVYENIVENSQDEIKALLEFCGLAYEEQCNNFYQADRIVQTASVHQVRQPIYKSGMNQWKNYQRELQPLINILGN